jgi:hypothetical protein
MIAGESLIEFCAACDHATMAAIAAMYLPLHGPSIPCALCKGCCEALQNGDATLRTLIELRLLLQTTAVV